MRSVPLILVAQLVGLLGIVTISPAAQITSLSCSLVGANVIRSNPDDAPTNMNSLDLMVRTKIDKGDYVGASQDVLDCLTPNMYEIEHSGIKESVILLLKQDIDDDSKYELEQLLPYL
jgi:hypothetical protein